MIYPGISTFSWADLIYDNIEYINNCLRHCIKSQILSLYGRIRVSKNPYSSKFYAVTQTITLHKKIKFSIKDFFSKSGLRKLRIWSNFRGWSRTNTTYKTELFVIIVVLCNNSYCNNNYHKVLNLGCCSSPRSACAFIEEILNEKFHFLCNVSFQITLDI